MPKKIMGWLGKEDAPLLLRYGAIPHMWRWGLDFARNCTAAKAREHSLTNLRLAKLSLQSIQEIRAEHDFDYDVGTTGALKIYTSQSSLDSAAALGDEWARDGLKYEKLTVKQCVDREPALAEAASSLAGGLFFPGEEIGDPNKFTQALAKKAAELGVRFQYGTAVTKLIIRDGRVAAVGTSKGEVTGDAVVVAMGSFSADLLKTVGVRVSIYPVKGLTITVDAAPWKGAPQCAVIDDGRLFGLVPIGNRLRVSGSAEVAGYDTTPSRERCQAIIDNVISVFPSFSKCYDPAKAFFWAGLRPVASSGVPYLGVTSIPNLHRECRPWALRLDHGLRFGACCGKPRRTPEARHRCDRPYAGDALTHQRILKCHRFNHLATAKDFQSPWQSALEISSIPARSGIMASTRAMSATIPAGSSLMTAPACPNAASKRRHAVR